MLKSNDISKIRICTLLYSNVLASTGMETRSRSAAAVRREDRTVFATVGTRFDQLIDALDSMVVSLHIISSLDIPSLDWSASAVRARNSPVYP